MQILTVPSIFWTTLLSVAAIRMFGIWDEVQGKGAMWSLAGSMGGAAWFVVITALIILLGVLGGATLIVGA
jgi:hypothetical protein